MRHVILLILLAAVWGSSFVAIKIGVADMAPSTLAAGRVVMAALILYLYMRLRGETLLRSGPIWRLCFFVGLFGNALPFTLIGWGEVLIDSSLAAILMAVMPLATLVLAHFFTADEAMTAKRAAGVALGFGGMLVLFGPAAWQGLGGAVAHQLAVAGGALCYAVATIFARRLPPGQPVVHGTQVMICASVQMVPVAAFAGWPWTVMPGTESLLAMAYLGIVATAAATIVYLVIVAARGATFLSLINYMIPVMGVAWGVALLDEAVTGAGMAALALILAGVALAGSTPGRRGGS